MENQNNVGNQNTQQIGQNPVSQSVQIQKKPRINYWIISTLILALLFFGILGLYLFSVYKNNQLSPNIIPINQQNLTKPANTKTGNPKLTTSLNELYGDWSQSPAVATEKAKKRAVEIDGDRVKVTFIMSDDVTAKSALNTIVSLGGEVTANYETWIDAWIPVISLEEVTEFSGVNQVREPIAVVPLNQK